MNIVCRAYTCITKRSNLALISSFIYLYELTSQERLSLLFFEYIGLTSRAFITKSKTYELHMFTI